MCPTSELPICPSGRPTSSPDVLIQVCGYFLYRESTKGVRALSMALTSGLSGRPYPSKTINAVFFIVSFGATNLGIIGAKKDPLVGRVLYWYFQAQKTFFDLLKISYATHVFYRFSTKEQSGSKTAFELHPIAVHTNPRAFSKSIYRLIIEVVELFNSCFARFSHMSASFNWIQVMGIDVEWHPAPCLKTRRVDDGHIVGRTNANTG